MKKVLSVYVGKRFNLRGNGIESIIVSEELLNKGAKKEIEGKAVLFKGVEELTSGNISNVLPSDSGCKSRDNKDYPNTPRFPIGEEVSTATTLLPPTGCTSTGMPSFNCRSLGTLSVPYDYVDKLLLEYPLIVGFNSIYDVVTECNGSSCVNFDSVDKLDRVICNADLDFINLNSSNQEPAIKDDSAGGLINKRKVVGYTFSCVIPDTISNQLLHYDFIVVCKNGCQFSYVFLIDKFLAMLSEHCPLLKGKVKSYRPIPKTNIDGLELSKQEAMINEHNKSMTSYIALSCHFNCLDITNLEDHDHLYGGRLNQISNNAVGMIKNKLCWYTLRSINDLPTTAYRKRCVKTKLTIRDTLLLSPDKATIKDLGKSMNVPSKERDAVEDYFSLTGKARDEFFEQVFHDSVADLFWTVMVINKDFSNTTVPVTVSSMAQKLFIERICKINGWKRKEFNEKYLSIETLHYGNTHKKLISKERQITEQTASDSFYGGYNCAFSHGLFVAKPGESFIDIDFKSAYPICMSILNNIDWEDSIKAEFNRFNTPGGILQERMFEFNDLGFGKITFSFSKDEKHPCLPVRTSNGASIIYPLEGETFATVPEIKLALQVGAKVEIAPHSSIYIMNTTKSKDAFEVVKSWISERAEISTTKGKDSPEALLLKLMTNSVFGKFAQGVKKKEGGPGLSEISLPHYAAGITGLLRCLVNFSIQVCQSNGWKVHSVTTDGFIVEGPEKEIYDTINCELRKVFPFLFTALKEAFGSDKTAIEIKHRQQCLFNIKTRGNISPEVGGVMAKAGYSVSQEFKKLSEADQHIEFFEKVINRKGRVENRYQTLPSLKEAKSKGIDLVIQERVKYVNFDFDFKRMIDKDTIENNSAAVNGKLYSYDSFFTVPFHDLADYEKVRDHIRKKESINTEAEYLNVYSWYHAKCLRKEKSRFNNAREPGNPNLNNHIISDLIKEARKGLLGENIQRLSCKKLYEVLSRDFKCTIQYDQFEKMFGKGKSSKIIPFPSCKVEYEDIRAKLISSCA